VVLFVVADRSERVVVVAGFVVFGIGCFFMRGGVRQ
jgi:hypothetical protein